MTETTTTPTETSNEPRTTTTLFSVAELEAIASMRHMTTMREGEEVLEHVLLELSSSGWRASVTDRFAVVEQSYTLDPLNRPIESPSLKVMLHRDLLETIRRTYCKGSRSSWWDTKIMFMFVEHEGEEFIRLEVTGDKAGSDMTVFVEKGDKFPAVERLFPPHGDLGEVPFMAVGMNHLQRIAKVITPEEAVLTPGKRFSGFKFRVKELGASQMFLITKVLGNRADEARKEWGRERKFRVVLQGLTNKNLQESW